jgi:hypothetical protein
MSLITITIENVGTLEILQFIANSNKSNIAVFSENGEYYYTGFPIFAIAKLVEGVNEKILEIPYTNEFRNAITNPSSADLSNFLSKYRGYCERIAIEKLMPGITIAEKINIAPNKLDSQEANNNFLALFDN